MTWSLCASVEALCSCLSMVDTDMDVEVMCQKNFKARKIMGQSVVARKNGYSFVDSLPQIAVFNYMKVPLGYGSK